MCTPFSIFNFTRNASNSKSESNSEPNKNYNADGDDIKWEDTVEFTFPIEGGRVIKV